jgi:hypothetical protein
MNLERYPVKASDDFKRFEFESVGPKGRIKKVIKFEEIGNSGLFNLAFGDLDENSDNLISRTRSNNGDRDKVLATVASAVFEFMLVYSNALISARGETGSRTRLYQMGISKNLNELTLRYIIYGRLNNKWEIFQKGKNYEAFALKKRALM